MVPHSTFHATIVKVQLLILKGISTGYQRFGQRSSSPQYSPGSDRHSRAASSEGSRSRSGSEASAEVSRERRSSSDLGSRGSSPAGSRSDSESDKIRFSDSDDQSPTRSYSGDEDGGLSTRARLSRLRRRNKATSSDRHQPQTRYPGRSFEDNDSISERSESDSN